MTRIPSGSDDVRGRLPALLVMDSVLFGGSVSAIVAGAIDAQRILSDVPELQGSPFYHPLMLWVYLVIVTWQAIMFVPFGIIVASIDAWLFRKLGYRQSSWIISSLVTIASAAAFSASWVQWIVLGLPLRVNAERVWILSFAGAIGIASRRFFQKHVNGRGRYKVAEEQHD